MNLLLLSQDDYIDSSHAVITGRRLVHLRHVLNVRPGQILQVGLLNDKTGIGRVLSMNEAGVILEVELTHPPPEPLPIKVILAMPRPKVLRRILQGLTAMGIKEIILCNSWRVEKSYWQSPLLEPASLREHLMLGLEQARDTVLPRIQKERRFKPFVEDSMPALIAGTCALVADPQASSPCPANVDRPVTLAIGPEGGFTSYELNKLDSIGFNGVHLGKRPLRVETVVAALLGRLSCCR